MPKLAKYKIVVQRKFIFWYWTLVSTKNTKTMGSSETYSSKNKALQTATMLGEAFKIKVEIQE